MRASQFTAGIFAGALALLSVMSTAEKPFDAKGVGGEQDDPKPSTWVGTTAPPPATTEPRTGSVSYDTPSYDPTVSRTTPTAFEVTWKYVTMPNRNASATGYSEKYGYVLEQGNFIRDPQNSAEFLPTQQVQYIDYQNYTEVFDLRDFNPNAQPQLYTIESFYTDQNKALLKSVNQAIKDDFARKKTAYEIWQKMITAPTDMYPNTPSAYTVMWDEIIMPNTDKNAAGYNEEYGYVLEPGPGIPDPINKDLLYATRQVQYITVKNYTETFDFRYFDPDQQPALYDVNPILKIVGSEHAKMWALNTSLNEAILSDHERKVAAFKRWRSEVENGTYQPTAPSAFATTEPTTRIYYDPTEPTTRYIPTTQPYTTSPTYPPTTAPRPATDPTQPTTNTGSDLSRGDINHDGYINAKDASILLRYAAAYGTGQNPKLDDFLD